MDNKSFARIAVWILVAVVLFTVFRQFETNSTQSLDTTSYTQFMDDAKAGKIRRVDIPVSYTHLTLPTNSRV
mgnify:CR=1 FL=1